RMIEEVARIPGVTAVGTVDDAPLSSGGSSTSVYKEETTEFRGSNSVASARYYAISPGYLRAAQTRLLAGRDFTWNDSPGSPEVAMINQLLARRLFGDAPVVGRKFRGGD